MSRLCPHLNLLRDDPNSIEWRLDRILHKKAVSQTYTVHTHTCTDMHRHVMQIHKHSTLLTVLNITLVLARYSAVEINCTHRYNISYNYIHRGGASIF